MIKRTNQMKNMNKIYLMQMRIATQIKSGITINDDVGEKIRKSIMRAKKIIFRILLLVIMKKANI